jgi:hypothetical protein
VRSFIIEHFICADEKGSRDDFSRLGVGGIQEILGEIMQALIVVLRSYLQKWIRETAPIASCGSRSLGKHVWLILLGINQ